MLDNLANTDPAHGGVLYFGPHKNNTIEINIASQT